MRRRAVASPGTNQAAIPRRRGAEAAQRQDDDYSSSDSDPSSSSSPPSSPDAARERARAAAQGAPARHRGAAAAARKLQRFASFEDLPEYLRDNEFIIGYYRPQQTPWSSLRTLWSMHNETGNVWTHLIGRRVLASRGAERGAAAARGPGPAAGPATCLLPLERCSAAAACLQRGLACWQLPAAAVQPLS